MNKSLIIIPNGVNRIAVFEKTLIVRGQRNVRVLIQSGVRFGFSFFFNCRYSVFDNSMRFGTTQKSFVARASDIIMIMNKQMK